MTEPSDLVRTGMELVNDHDLDGYCRLFADDIVWVNHWGTLTGRQAASDYIQQGLGPVPDHHRRVDKLLTSGEDVAAWMTLSGTFQGRYVEMEFCTIFTVRDDRIARVVEYADWQPLLDALGLTA